MCVDWDKWSPCKGQIKSNQNIISYELRTKFPLCREVGSCLRTEPLPSPSTVSQLPCFRVGHGDQREVFCTIGANVSRTFQGQTTHDNPTRLTSRDTWVVDRLGSRKRTSTTPVGTPQGNGVPCHWYKVDQRIHTTLSSVGTEKGNKTSLREVESRNSTIAILQESTGNTSISSREDNDKTTFKKSLPTT